MRKKIIEILLLFLSSFFFFTPWFYGNNVCMTLDSSLSQMVQIDSTCKQPIIIGFHSSEKAVDLLFVHDYSVHNMLSNFVLILPIFLILLNVLSIFFLKGRILPYVPKSMLVTFYLYIFIANSYYIKDLNLLKDILSGFYLNTLFTWIYLFYNTKR